LRCRYFCDASNVFDFFIVMSTSIQLYVLDPLSFKTGGKLSLFRLLRFVRTIRVLRMIRVMRMFTELRVLVQTFISSMRALMWSMVFLFFIMVLSAVFITFALQDFIMVDTNSYNARVWVTHHYGDPMSAFYTMFEVTLAGCWPQYFRPLVEKVSGYYSIFVFGYVSVVVFAVTRIITALFLKETLQVAANDAEQQSLEQKKKRKGYIDKLRRVFDAVDTSGDGKLSLAEFILICHSSDVQVYLKMLELDVSNAENLFHLLDPHDVGEISFEEFLQGVMRLKGHARSLDIVAMMRAQDHLCVDMQHLSEQVDKLCERVCGDETSMCV